MVRAASLLALCLSMVGPLGACSGSSSGGDDDDDIVIDQGDGDADTDGDTDADGDRPATCEGACANAADICPEENQAACIESCSLIEDNLSGAECLAAFGDLNGCLAGASQCTADQGIQGCDQQSTALNTACDNGCVAILECANACGADQTCGQACFDNADPAAQQALQAVYQCLIRECGELPAEGTPEADTWNDCADAAVQDPAKCAAENIRCR